MWPDMLVGSTMAAFRGDKAIRNFLLLRRIDMRILDDHELELVSGGRGGGGFWGGVEHLGQDVAKGMVSGAITGGVAGAVAGEGAGAAPGAVAGSIVGAVGGALNFLRI